MNDRKIGNSPAFPHHEDGMSGTSPGMSLRHYFASHVDVSVYDPINTFRNARGREPSVEELATYVAEIRMLEADALLKTCEASQYEYNPDTLGLKRISSFCSRCGEPQFNSPSGITCRNGHGGAPPKE
jgi:hypothetical protein